VQPDSTVASSCAGVSGQGTLFEGVPLEGTLRRSSFPFAQNAAEDFDRSAVDMSCDQESSGFAMTLSDELNQPLRVRRGRLPASHLGKEIPLQ